MIKIATVTLLALFAVSLASPASAQTRPIWYTASDAISVLSTNVDHGFAYAIVRDDGMHGHNTFCVTIGAHIGKLSVVAIGANGIVLSNGRMVANSNAVAPSDTLVAAGHH